MRLLVLSDLHLERGIPYRVPYRPAGSAVDEDKIPYHPTLDTVADVVVLAGDIHRRAKGVEFGRLLAPTPVIYVAGNHEFEIPWANEFYTLDEVLAELRTAAAGTNVAFLENDELVLGGVRFLGCTLWTDFNLFGDPSQAMEQALGFMPDYVSIFRGRGVALRPEDTLALHRASLAWLEERLAHPHPGPTVVVTHHAPSRRSVRARHENDLLATAFVSDLERLCGADRVRLWIHGHTHYSLDYEVNGTRIFSNQLGLVADTCSMYRHGLVVNL